jgi:hypothetical protein
VGLGIPSVIGPITEWFDVVVVEGCSPGASIVVQTDDPVPAVIAAGASTGGRDRVPVVGPLKAGQRLVAFQSVPGDTSLTTPSNLAVVVGASPTGHSQLPAMAFATHLHECGKAIWLKGAAPGAQVTLANGPTLLGSGRADREGNARFVTVPLPHQGTLVRATQAAPPGFPGLAGAPQVADANTQGVVPGRLPVPTVQAPFPTGCDSALRVSGIVDGAEVTIERASDGQRETAIFDLDTLWFNLSRPFLAAGDRIYVTQGMTWCEHPTSDPLAVDISAATQPSPIVIDPPCVGSSLVRVRHLRAGATLTIDVPGRSSLTYQIPPGATTWDAPVESLPGQTTVRATMIWCTFSTSTTVAAQGASPPPAPSIDPPLFGCARAISVSTATGCRVEVWGDLSGRAVQLSPRIYARSALLTTAISPFLSIPESVWARQLACDGTWQEGPRESVKGHARLEQVELAQPLIEGARAVLPTNALAGAHVTVWASAGGDPAQMIGERDTTKADPVVGLIRTLTTRDVVWAIQELCVGETTEPEPRYSVEPGVVRFQLSSAIEQDSRGTPTGKAILHAATLECRFLGGRWSLMADAEDTDPGYDLSLYVNAVLNLPNPLAFGAGLDMDVAAAGNLPQGLESLGYPPRWTQYKSGTFALLQNPAFWEAVISATANWSMVAAWRNYAPVGDPPEWVKGKNAPPDPNAIPNDPVVSDDD